MGCGWNKVKLGETGLLVSPLGLSASYGASGSDVEHAFDSGINYFYWGSFRTSDFGAGLRRIGAQNREKIVTVVQTYTRAGFFMRRSLESALRKLNTDYTDLLLLGWWNAVPPQRILDAALKLQAEGKAKHILISCHNRQMFKEFMANPAFGAIMVRYNAAHPGAETEVFPFLKQRRVGVVAYTATRWGDLVNPKKIPEGEAVPRASDCYRFALTNPSVDVSLIGPKNRDELNEAMLALDRGPMSEDELAWMKRVGKAVRNRQMGFIQRMKD
ncbi:MAG: aldo/keto reductase [Blastocatellia bacterium]|nr:aldo/keto reductase [Blastocatellia bacterium]